MPIDSKECFAALTEDGQLWEIYQAAQTGGGASGPAGGDLTGTYPNPTVDGLQGTPVSSATPYNGQVLQFDGTNWVPGSIPSGGSGGGGVVYFLNFNTAADAPVTNIPQTPNASKELAIAVDTVATSYTSANLPTASYAFLGSFVTDLNVPSATSIPAGLWDFNIYAESSTTNVANQVYFKIEVLKYDGVNAPTLISTSNDTYIYDPTEVTQYVSSCIIPSGVTLTATDRLVVYLYGRAHQANKDITFHFGSTYPSHTHSTMPSVTGTGVVKVVNGVFQSPASTIVDSDVSATANIAQSKIANLTTDLAGKVSKSGDTMTGKLTLPASTTTFAPINIPNGLDPTSPSNGDIWLNGSIRYRDQAGTTRFVADLNRPNTFSQRQVINADQFTTLPALRITQEGTGEALRVEDSPNPDATAFVVSASGRVGVGVTPDTAVALSVDTTGIKFGDNTVQTTAAVSGVTSVTATAPLTSSGGATPNISTSIATNRIVGRSTAGTGVMEELTPVGITVSGGNITGIGGTVGTVDNAVPRADGTGGFTVQGSDIVIDDATTSTQNNVAITNQHAGQTNSALVLTPKGTGAFILGPKPNGTATGGNARGDGAVDLQNSSQFTRSLATQVASGRNSVICGGAQNTSSSLESVVCGGYSNTASSQSAVVAGGFQNVASTGLGPIVGGGFLNIAQANGAGVFSGGDTAGGNTASGIFSSILGGYHGLSNRYGMQAHASGSFGGSNFRGDAQRARFVLRCKTTGASAVEMALDGSTTYLGIPSGKVIACTINISGVKSDGSAVAHYVRQYAVKNVGGTSSEVYAPVTIGSDNAAGTTIALSANNADDTLRIAVTGIAAETWRWVASVDAVEIAYGT